MAISAGGVDSKSRQVDAYRLLTDNRCCRCANATQSILQLPALLRQRRCTQRIEARHTARSGCDIARGSIAFWVERRAGHDASDSRQWARNPHWWSVSAGQA